MVFDWLFGTFKLCLSLSFSGLWSSVECWKFRQKVDPSRGRGKVCMLSKSMYIWFLYPLSSRSHVSVFVWKWRFFFSAFLLTLRFWILFSRASENAVVTESGTFFDWSMGISSHLVRGVGSWIQHRDVFVFPASTRVQQTAFSKILALESDLKRCVSADRFPLHGWTIGQTRRKKIFIFKHKRIRAVWTGT